MKHTGQTLREYAMSGPQGQGTAKNIRFWTARATENSQCAPRGRDGEMKLFDTNRPTRPPRKSG